MRNHGNQRNYSVRPYIIRRGFVIKCTADHSMLMNQLGRLTYLPKFYGASMLYHYFDENWRNRKTNEKKSATHPYAKLDLFFIST